VIADAYPGVANVPAVGIAIAQWQSEKTLEALRDWAVVSHDGPEWLNNSWRTAYPCISPKLLAKSRLNAKGPTRLNAGRPRGPHLKSRYRSNNRRALTQSAIPRVIPANCAAIFQKLPHMFRAACVLFALKASIVSLRGYLCDTAQFDLVLLWPTA
jgi:hypothetical protein